MSTRRHDDGTIGTNTSRNRFGARWFFIAIVAAFILGFAVIGVLSLAPAITGVAQATDLKTESGGQKVVVFEDLVIGPDQTWENVVVVGGDVVIAGAVSESVVIVGGDLTMRSSARIGYGHWNDSEATAVVSVFGHVTWEGGAQVSGRVVDVGGKASDAFAATFVDSVARPWRWSSAVGWIATTVFLAVVAVVMVAIAPRKIAMVGDRARRHLFSSFGWGVLGVVIGIPLVTVLLIVSVVGLLVVVPWLVIGVPITLLFGFVALAALLGRLILGERDDRRGEVMMAAVLGVVVLSVLRWIPYAGAIIVALTILIGLGAIITAIWEGNRRPRVRMPATPERPIATEWRPSSGDARGGTTPTPPVPPAGVPSGGGEAPAEADSGADKPSAT